MTQLEMIREQAQAAAQNAARKAVAGARRETSLVGQASRLAGKAIRAGQSAVKGGAARARGAGRETGPVIPARPKPSAPAEDGYVRRSPVQQVHVAADYRRRQVRRAIGIVLLVAAAAALVIALNYLGVFAR